MNAWYRPPSDFLGNLTGTDRVKFLALCSRRGFQKGEHVFRAGAPGENVYVLGEGHAKIYKLSESGKEVTLWFCLPGELFGLAEVPRGGRREVFAQVCTAAQVYCISRPSFISFLATHPETALQIIDVLSCRTRVLGDTLLNLVSDDATSRVIKLLVRLRACYGRRVGSTYYLDVPVTHQDMAEMIGATRQTVSAILSELKRAGALRFERRRICIASDDALERFARDNCLMNPQVVTASVAGAE